MRNIHPMSFVQCEHEYNVSDKTCVRDNCDKSYRSGWRSSNSSCRRCIWHYYTCRVQRYCHRRRCGRGYHLHSSSL